MKNYAQFGMGFDLLFDLFPIFFIVIFGVVIWTFIKGIFEWNKNNHSPRLMVDASVISKRTNVSHHHHGDDMAMSHSSTSYYVTFQVESGDRMEFLVSGQEFGMLAEGDKGKLTFQGTRYVGFERQY